jgi:TPR repeat protein
VNIYVDSNRDRDFRYRKAADKSAKALMMVGRCFQDGVGVGKDEHQAVETFLAAASTHETAQMQLVCVCVCVGVCGCCV